MVGDTGFEPVTSTVGAQKDKKAEKIRVQPCKEMISQVIRFSIYFDFFAYFSIFLTNFGHSFRIKDLRLQDFRKSYLYKKNALDSKSSSLHCECVEITGNCEEFGTSQNRFRTAPFQGNNIGHLGNRGRVDNVS